MNAEDKRAQRLQLLEDHIGRALCESEASGELEAAPSYGKPLDFGDGYDETPPELRMGFKLLKDAGVLLPEVEVFRQVAALREEVKTCTDEDERRRLNQRIGELQQQLALRLEKLRVTGSL